MRNITFLVVASVVSICIRGFIEEGGNDAFVVPFIDKINHPEWFKDDYTFSFDYHNTFFYYFLAWLAKWFSIETVFGVSYLLSSILYVWVIDKWVRVLFPGNNLIRYAAVFALSIPKHALGLSQTFYAEFSYNNFSISFCFLSVYAFFKGRYIRAYALLGFVFLFHALATIHFISLYSVYWLIRLGKQSNKLRKVKAFIKTNTIKQLAYAHVIFIILCLPLIVFRQSSDSNSLFHADELWVYIQRVRSSHHIFPFEWVKQYFTFAPFFVLGVVGFNYYSKKRKDGHNSHFHKKLILFLLGLIPLLIIGTIFTEFYPVEAIILFQYFRATYILTTFCVLYGIYYLLDNLNQKDNYVKFSIIITFVGMIQNNYLLLYAGLVFVIANEFKFISPNLLKFFLISGTLLWLIIAFYLLIGEYEFTILNKLSKYFDFTSIITIVSMFASWSIINFKENWLYYAFLTVGMLIGFARYYEINWREEEQIKMHRDWVDIQIWAKNHTELNDSFIVPPQIQGFRIHSKRSIFGDWKDGTHAFFSHKFAYEWYKRVNELGVYNAKDLPTAYNHLKEQDFIRIAKKYNQKFVITEKNHSLNFKNLYQNKSFSMYEIN